MARSYGPAPKATVSRRRKRRRRRKKAEDDYPTWTYRRLGGGHWQTRKGGKGSTTIPY